MRACQEKNNELLLATIFIFSVNYYLLNCVRDVLIRIDVCMFLITHSILIRLFHGYQRYTLIIVFFCNILFTITILISYENIFKDEYNDTTRMTLIINI